MFSKKPIVFQHVHFFIPLFWNEKLSLLHTKQWMVLGAAGGVYYVSEDGTCKQAFKAESSILKLLYYEEKNILITVTEGLSLYQHAVMPEGDTREIMKVSICGTEYFI